MDKCIRELDDKKLYMAIEDACLNNRQSKFEIELYRFNRGFMGLPSKFSEENVEPRKISAFLKRFGQEHKMECEMLEKESHETDYTMVSVASIRLPKTTVSDIENAQISRNREHENSIRKKVLPYYGQMNNYSLSKELRPLVLNDIREVIRKAKQESTIHNDRVKVSYIVTKNFIQIDPDYKSRYYSMYRFAEYGGQNLDTPDMTALALVILDYVFTSIEHEYSTQCVQRSIRVLNIGVEVTIQVGVYFS